MTQRQRRRTLREPLVPGWMWAGLITSAALMALFVMNSLVADVAGLGGNAPLVCYPVQLLAFLINGVLAGFLDAHRQRIKTTMFPHRAPPNWAIIGALAGVVVAVIGAIIYIAVTVTTVSLLPPALELLGETLPILIVVDTVAALGLGLVGGFIYGRYLR